MATDHAEDTRREGKSDKVRVEHVKLRTTSKGLCTVFFRSWRNTERFYTAKIDFRKLALAIVGRMNFKGGGTGIKIS